VIPTSPRGRAAGLALGLLLVLAGGALAIGLDPGPGPGNAIAEAASSAATATDAEPLVPERARATLAEIQRLGGEPPPGHVGGRTFQNRERRLPRGHYREYDVNPRRAGRPRDAERIVIEQKSGKAYYTGDHYRTFVPIE
jgi:ribonuclease T1